MGSIAVELDQVGWRMVICEPEAVTDAWALTLPRSCSVRPEIIGTDEYLDLLWRLANLMRRGSIVSGCRVSARARISEI